MANNYPRDGIFNPQLLTIKDKDPNRSTGAAQTAVIYEYICMTCVVHNKILDSSFD